MPELPEVETMRRGIAPAIGARIERFEIVRTRCKPITITPSLAVMRRRLTGAMLVGTRRIGKRVLVELDSGWFLMFEPRMTGLVLLSDPPDEEHLRVRIELGGSKTRQLLYWDRRGLGLVRLFSPAELEDRFSQGQIGPDALDLPLELFQERLATRKTPIKVALLDQKALAGVGNLYASEILHVAGIHPERRASQLKSHEWQRLHVALQDVLNTAIRYEGSTLSDGTYRNALNETGSYQNHHRVYDLAGEACRTCLRQPVQRIVQAQRSTFFCPVCQPKRPR
jgi:formamidopyrimidine-DNA glycosylase